MSCKACTQIPVVASNYEPKGAYQTVDGLKTCSLPSMKVRYVRASRANSGIDLTGPRGAKKALLCVYDIFGLHSHTLQGADRLTALMPDTLILVPDFFKGEPASPDWIPADTEEKKQRLTTFMATKADPEPNLRTLLSLTAAAQAEFGSVRFWGVYGLCWGGKLSALVSGPNTPFLASGTAHPGRLDVADAKALTIPYICLFSKQDGDEATVSAYTETLAKSPTNYVEKYGTMHHGWMGARANLSDKDNIAEYERGYQKFADFYNEHLK